MIHNHEVESSSLSLATKIENTSQALASASAFFLHISALDNVMQTLDTLISSASAVAESADVANSDNRNSLIGEQGAVNLDKAEEATTRLDNLAVAREMETAGKDAKVIKLSTGWERGADGLWRYEIMDDEINQNAIFN